MEDSERLIGFSNDPQTPHRSQFRVPRSRTPSMIDLNSTNMYEHIVSYKRSSTPNMLGTVKERYNNKNKQYKSKFHAEKKLKGNIKKLTNNKNIKKRTIKAKETNAKSLPVLKPPRRSSTPNMIIKHKKAHSSSKLNIQAVRRRSHTPTIEKAQKTKLKTNKSLKIQTKKKKTGAPKKKKKKKVKSIPKEAPTPPAYELYDWYPPASLVKLNPETYETASHPIQTLTNRTNMSGDHTPTTPGFSPSLISASKPHHFFDEIDSIKSRPTTPSSVKPPRSRSVSKRLTRVRSSPHINVNSIKKNLNQMTSVHQPHYNMYNSSDMYSPLTEEIIDSTRSRYRQQSPTPSPIRRKSASTSSSRQRMLSASSSRSTPNGMIFKTPNTSLKEIQKSPKIIPFSDYMKRTNTPNNSKKSLSINTKSHTSQEITAKPSKISSPKLKTSKNANKKVEITTSPEIRDQSIISSLHNENIKLFKKGCEFLEKKRYQLALDCFENALSYFKNFKTRLQGLCHLKIAQSYLENHQFSLAIDEYSKAIQSNTIQDPEMVGKCYFNRGSANVDVTNIADAISDFKVAIKYFQNTAFQHDEIQCYQMLAKLYHSQDDFENVVDQCQSALALLEHHVQKKGRISEEEYNVLSPSLTPRHEEEYLEKMYIQLKSQWFQSSVQNLTDDTFAAIHCLQLEALSHIKLSQFDRAICCFEQIIQEFGEFLTTPQLETPNSPTSPLDLRKDQEFSMSKSTNGNCIYAECLLGIGDAYLAQGFYENSATFYKRAEKFSQLGEKRHQFAFHILLFRAILGQGIIMEELKTWETAFIHLSRANAMRSTCGIDAYGPLSLQCLYHLSSVSISMNLPDKAMKLLKDPLLKSAHLPLLCTQQHCFFSKFSSLLGKHYTHLDHENVNLHHIAFIHSYLGFIKMKGNSDCNKGYASPSDSKMILWQLSNTIVSHFVPLLVEEVGHKTCDLVSKIVFQAMCGSRGTSPQADFDPVIKTDHINFEDVKLPSLIYLYSINVTSDNDWMFSIIDAHLSDLLSSEIFLEACKHAHSYTPTSRNAQEESMHFQIQQEIQSERALSRVRLLWDKFLSNLLLALLEISQ